MDPKVLRKLEKVAPVTVVAGNLDDPKVMGELPREIADQVDGVRFVVGHKPKRLLNRLVRGKLSLRRLRPRRLGSRAHPVGDLDRRRAAPEPRYGQLARGRG